MPVTEYALIELRGGHNEHDFLGVLKECQEIQDKWMCHHQPHSVEDRNTPLSTMYIQNTDPLFLLITAPWDSPEAHTHWIESRENQAGFGKLSEYIAPGNESVLLFHMDPAGAQLQLRSQFPSESFNVWRISVEPGQREAMQQKYQVLEKGVQKLDASGAVWAGWRIEKPGNTEDMIIFASPDVAEERLRELTSNSDSVDQRYFQHVV